MTETSKKTPVTGGKAARLGQSPSSAAVAKSAEDASLTEGQANGLQAFVEANEAVMTAMAALSQEMMSFGSQRLRANMERSESLATCDDLNRAFQIQADFLEAATRQYLAQTNTVLSIMTTMNQSLLLPMQMTTLALTRQQRDASD